MMIMGITKRFNGTQLEQELTKPCPLMDDGKWVRCDVVLNVADASTGTITANWSTPDHASKYGLTVSCNANLIFTCNFSSGWKFAECRLTVETEANPTATMSLQGSNAWQITTSKNQNYYALDNSAFQKLEVGKKVYVEFYCYIVPQVH